MPHFGDLMIQPRYEVPQKTRIKTVKTHREISNHKLTFIFILNMLVGAFILFLSVLEILTLKSCTHELDDTEQVFYGTGVVTAVLGGFTFLLSGYAFFTASGYSMSDGDTKVNPKS
jgi:hypothetical protein